MALGVKTVLNVIHAPATTATALKYTSTIQQQVGITNEKTNAIPQSGTDLRKQHPAIKTSAEFLNVLHSE